MRRNHGIGAGPIKESIRGRHDHLVDALAAEIRFFVDNAAIEVENPGFYVAFWYEVDNPFFCRSRRQLGGRQCMFELTKAPISVARICVDGND